MNKELADKIKIFTGICVIIVILLVMSIAFKEEINSVEAFQAYIDKFGVFAPIALIAFQAFQVVVPMFPGQFGYAVGTIAFGVHAGFWCNYIGICLGSFIAYVLARKYGVSLVLAFFPEKQYNKWQRKIAKSRSYDWLFFIATLLPMFPDDLLCYFSGLMKMNMKKYILILIVGKPWCILAYCIIFGFIK